MAKLFPYDEQIAHWRAMRKARALRLSRARHRDLRIKPKGIRPGGNTYGPALISVVTAPLPIVKHVAQNTYRAGAMAYSMLYHYWRPGA